MNEKKKQFQIWLPPELKSRMAAAAKQCRRSMSSFALLAIEAACAKAEAAKQDRRSMSSFVSSIALLTNETACVKEEEQCSKPLEDRKNV